MERLIRQRGLTKRVISRRARLLHNVYAWMRVISESTNVLHDEHLLSELAEIPTVENCFTELSADDLPLHSFQEASAKGMDNFLYLVEYKTQSLHDTEAYQKSAEGQLDLHLTSPLVERDGMCMQIYGVPETWLRLVSQTTRLANLLDKLIPEHPGRTLRCTPGYKPCRSLWRVQCALFKNESSYQLRTPHLICIWFAH